MTMRNRNAKRMVSNYGFVGLALLVFGCARQEEISKFENGPVDKFVDYVNSLVQANAIEDAIAALDEVDVDKLVESTLTESEKKDSNIRRLIKFVGWEEYTHQPPGVPQHLDSDLLANIKMMEITGVRRFEPERELERNLHKSAGVFALKFNSRMYRKALELGHAKPARLSSEQVRLYSNIDEATWNELPIEIQVFVEILVNQSLSEK